MLGTIAFALMAFFVIGALGWAFAGGSSGGSSDGQEQQADDHHHHQVGVHSAASRASASSRSSP